MWLFLPFGFFSVVKKGPDGMLCVRARAQADIERMHKLCPSATPVETDTGTDYRYRFYVPQEHFATLIADITATIDYGNFKARAHQFLPTSQINVLHRVWATLYDSWK